MSIIKSVEVGQDGEVQAILMNVNVVQKNGVSVITDAKSLYNPNEETRNMHSLILKHFALGSVNQQKPRIELNDLSVLLRDQTDLLSFNVYQPNNGSPNEASQDEAWRSNTIRPVVRNKCMSIAAHATARTIFPKVFAYDDQSDEQADAAMVMQDLMRWAADQSDYEFYALMRVLVALWSPMSIGMTDFAEVWRKVKTDKNADGTWNYEYMIDPDQSGFRDTVVPVDQFFFANFYERDVQKQPWIIFREVIDYDTAASQYQHLENWQYVQPGVQIIYNDANQAWYQVYDTNMRPYDVEKLTYWNKSLDVKIVEVNGVMMTDCDNPNPRRDKRYPFDIFGYSVISARCIAYKSLVSFLQGDADAVNTLYRLVQDGSYLEVMKPMVATGGQIIRTNVNIPGAVTSLQDPNAILRPVNPQPLDLRAGMDVMQKIEASLTESAADSEQPGQFGGPDKTAYEISKIEQKASMILGLFIKMIAKHVRDYGRLRVSDILQHYTVAEVSSLEPEAPLVYKTFLVQDTHGSPGGKSRKIKFDLSLPSDRITREEYLKLSRNVLEEEKGKKQTLCLVNPELFRKWKYEVVVSPDVLNPMSEDLERAFGLEEYDRMVQQPNMFDSDETANLLLGLYPKTKRDPSKFRAKKPGMTNVPGIGQVNQGQMGPGNGQGGAQTPPNGPGQGNVPTAGPSALARPSKGTIPSPLSTAPFVGLNP